MIVSFAWTTDALLRRWKTVTRRTWAESHAARFRPGVIFDAWDRVPFQGGKKIATCRVVSIRKERLRLLLEDNDYGVEEIAKEGGLWESPCEFCYLWGAPGGLLFVDQHPNFEIHRLEFEIVSIP